MLKLFRFVLIFVSFCVSNNLYSQKLSISIYNSIPLSTILVTPTQGQYNLIIGDSTYNLKVNQILYLSRLGDSIVVRTANQTLGTWKRVTIIGKTGNDVIRVKPIVPATPARLYDDNLSFYVDINKILAINLIDQEKYIAAVVEAEGGYHRNPEFYKVQAMLVRTYTLSHSNRHQSEGFNLCDEVHCQAYKGRSDNNSDILDAVLDTKGLIIVDSANHPITAAFHANCGGETANSGDVWVKPLPYLVSVHDKYCTSSPSARWQRTVPTKEWFKMLADFGVDTSTVLKRDDVDFDPSDRPVYYTVKGVKIPVKEIRKRFMLRSAWFSVSLGRKEVRLNGRGYGHGVGLCQDGAMVMADKGFSYDEIVKYYYKGVKIVDSGTLDSLQFSTDTLEIPREEPMGPMPKPDFMDQDHRNHKPNR